MIVTLIVVRDLDSPEQIWVEGAWDENSIKASPAEFQRQVEDAQEHGHVRLQPIELPRGTLKRLYEPEPVEVKILEEVRDG